MPSILPLIPLGTGGISDTGAGKPAQTENSLDTVSIGSEIFETPEQSETDVSFEGLFVTLSSAANLQPTGQGSTGDAVLESTGDKAAATQIEDSIRDSGDLADRLAGQEVFQETPPEALPTKAAFSQSSQTFTQPIQHNFAAPNPERPDQTGSVEIPQVPNKLNESISNNNDSRLSEAPNDQLALNNNDTHLSEDRTNTFSQDESRVSSRTANPSNASSHESLSTRLSGNSAASTEGSDHESASSSFANSGESTEQFSQPGTAEGSSVSPSLETASAAIHSAAPMSAANLSQFHAISDAAQIQTPIAEQLSDSIVTRSQLVTGNGDIHFQMELNPPELGKIWVHLTKSDGGLAAKIIVSQEAARIAIENQLPTLQQALDNAGLTLNEFSLSHDSDGYGDQWYDRGTFSVPADAGDRSSSQNPVQESHPSVTGLNQVDLLA